MRRILGYSTNDPSLTPDLFEHLGAPLSAATAAPLASWGIGYDQESQALVRRKPEELHALDLRAALLDLRADAFVAFASGLVDPSRREENTEPYRYRDWMLVSTHAFDGLTPGALSLHPALQGSVLGSTGAEQVFFHFLGELRERGVSWSDPAPPLARVRQALAATLLAVESRVDQPEGCAVLLSHGRMLCAGTLGSPLYAASVRGLELVREGDPLSLRRSRRLSFDHLRACAVIGGVEAPPEGWERVAGRAIFTNSAGWVQETLPLEAALG